MPETIYGARGRQRHGMTENSCTSSCPNGIAFGNAVFVYQPFRSGRIDERHVDLVIVFLRHSRAATTTDVYMQEIPESVQATVNACSGLFKSVA